MSIVLYMNVNIVFSQFRNMLYHKTVAVETLRISERQSRVNFGSNKLRKILKPLLPPPSLPYQMIEIPIPFVRFFFLNLENIKLFLEIEVRN